MNDKILASATAWATEIRRVLHQYPELSGEEYRTSAYLQELLLARNWEVATIEGTRSFLAFKKGNRPYTLGYRAELDALPIQEPVGTLASKHKGIMHACGHDIHMALAMGLSFLRDETKDETWPNLLLVFESSEEVLPGGALAILNSAEFQAHRPSMMLAFHCEPDAPVGTIGYCMGQYMASGDEIRITVNGKAAHGALPHTGVDSLLVAAHILIALQTIASRNAPPTASMVLSFGNVVCNGLMNLIPASVRIDGTLRTHSEDWRLTAKELIARIASHTALSFGAEATIDITTGYPSLYNDPELTTLAIRTFEACNIFKLQALPQRMTTDDFAYFSHTLPSLFLRLGVGPTGNLHSPNFCPSEEAISYGLLAIISLARELCKI
ncbi:MAG: M20 metallopeptidase family protein [Bacteroides sp.]